MEGYTENGAGTDVADQIGFAGIRRKKKQRRGLSVFQLKVIGAVALVLSAGSTTLVPLIFGSDTSNMTSLTAMVLCEVVSWFAAPIYAWLLVQGFQQTRNRVAYGVQLLCWHESPKCRTISPLRASRSISARRIRCSACSSPSPCSQQ